PTCFAEQPHSLAAPARVSSDRPAASGRCTGAMESDAAAPLREAWYFALPGSALKRGQMTAKTLLGEPMILGRADTGAVWALRDICPHRGIPLRFGRF